MKVKVVRPSELPKEIMYRKPVGIDIETETEIKTETETSETTKGEN